MRKLLAIGSIFGFLACLVYGALDNSSHTRDGRIMLTNGVVVADKIEFGEEETVFIGVGANATNNGLAIGFEANGTNHGAAIGYQANGARYGLAIGYLSVGYTYGVALGCQALGYASGVAIGYQAKGYNGTALGYITDGRNSGVAVGRYAEGNDFGVAIGYDSVGKTNAVAVGNGAYATPHSVAIGVGVTNTVPNSTRILGNLEMNGANVTDAYYYSVGNDIDMQSQIDSMPTSIVAIVHTSSVSVFDGLEGWQYAKGQVVHKTTDYIVTSNEYGMNLVMTHANDLITNTFTLPSGTNPGLIGLTMTFIKGGTGPMKVTAVDSNFILDSTNLVSRVTNETWSSATILLITTNKWIVKCVNGTWHTE